MLIRHSTRALAAVLMLLPLAAGCTGAATRPQHVSQTSPPAASNEIPFGVLTPIPGHLPITTSGVVEAYNQSAGHLIFKDGRVVQITNMTTVAGSGRPSGLSAR